MLKGRRIKFWKIRDALSWTASAKGSVPFRAVPFSAPFGPVPFWAPEHTEGLIDLEIGSHPPTVPP